MHPDGRVEGEPDTELREAMRQAAETGCVGRIETRRGPVAVEVARPTLRLVVFGAGPDAAPVVRIAVELGWSVELVDHRPAQARPERFPGAHVHLVPSEAAVARVGVDADTFALVMTHHYLIDRTLLGELLPSPAPSVGLLGPRQRAEDLLADLAEQGIEVSSEQCARLYAPAGVDLGGDGPEAIALSLVAQVLAVAEGRSAGWLRDRKGPIHEPGRA
jgi:xanthine/CO dehydrogenase XdhC/CoxF family maturation factor